jgi:hypothetical protein
VLSFLHPLDPRFNEIAHLYDSGVWEFDNDKVDVEHRTKTVANKCVITISLGALRSETLFMGPGPIITAKSIDICNFFSIVAWRVRKSFDSAHMLADAKLLWHVETSQYVPDIYAGGVAAQRDFDVKTHTFMMSPRGLIHTKVNKF